MISLSEKKVIVKGSAEFEKLIFQDFCEWLKIELGIEKISKDILLNYKKMPKHIYGDVDLKSVLDDSKTQIKINLDRTFGTSALLKVIAHEMTHIEQIYNMKLGLEDEWMTWNDNKIITVKEYTENNDFKKHIDLPWESQAYKNAEIYTDKYRQTDRLETLAKSDPTLKYIVDNNLL